MNRITTCCLVLVILVNSIVFAAPKGKLPIPRFVTIKFNEVNARTGPEHDCPIEWIFLKKGEPVEVVAEYGQWRKIKDINGDGGWVHTSVLSRHKSVILIGSQPTRLLKSPGEENTTVATLLPQIRCQLHKCHLKWCQISCKSYKGWVEQRLLWGVYPSDS